MTDLGIVTVICRELEVAGVIEVNADRVGELNVSASSTHVVSYMTGGMVVALPKAENGEMMTRGEVGEEMVDTEPEGMITVGTDNDPTEEYVELIALGEIAELELPIKIPLPSVLELSGAGEKTMLSGKLEDEAELEVSVGGAAGLGGGEMTGTDEAFDRMLVMTGSEAYEGKMVFTKGETAVAFRFVDEPLGEIGDADVKDVLFQKLWYGVPWLIGIKGLVVTEDTAVPLAIGDEDTAVPWLKEAVPEDKPTGPIDRLLKPVERGELEDSTTLLEGDVDSLEDTAEILIVVGTEKVSDGDVAEPTGLLEVAAEVGRVEVRVRNSVDLTITVVLFDEEVRTEVDAGGEPVAITAITLVLEALPLVGDDDTAGAGEYEEYSP